MSTVQPASTPMIVQVLQLIGVEEVILVVTALLALAFSGVFSGKQTGSSKSTKSLKRRPLHAEQTGSSMSPEWPKLRRGDVTLTDSCTQVWHQSGSQGACAEEPAQESQQMPSPLPGGSGEELAKKTSRQKWQEQRRLRRNASIASSDDPIKDALVAKIKSFQVSGKEEKLAWGAFCESQEGNNRDPSRYPVDVLQQFIEDYRSSEAAQERSSHPWNARKQPSGPTPAQALAEASAPCHVLSQKVESLVECALRRQDADVIAMYEEIKETVDIAPFLHALRRGKHLPIDVFTMLVQCAGRIGRTELIKVLFEDMNSAGINRPLAFYKSTMKLLASKKYYKEGMYVYSCLEADGLEPSPVMLSCLVSFAGELGDSKRAVGFLNSLSACSIPSFRDYTAILLVHSRDTNWPASVALLREMQDRQAPMNSLALNLALSTGVAAGQVEAANELLHEFSSIGGADVVSYNTIMKGFAQQKYGAQAIALLNEMCQVGVKPNAITFNTAMDAAIRSLRVIDAWQVLARMVEAGLAPDKVTRTVLMKGLHCGATSEQLAVILDLTQNATQDCEPGVCAKMFRSVIEAIVHVNDSDLAARAIAQMIDQRVTLPPSEYQNLLQVLSSDKDGNRMEQSKKTLTELHDIGKCSPCAFIYHKNGCRLGPACTRCHMCSPEELSKAFDDKKVFVNAKRVNAKNHLKWQRGNGCEPSDLPEINTVGHK